MASPTYKRLEMYVEKEPYAQNRKRHAASTCCSPRICSSARARHSSTKPCSRVKSSNAFVVRVWVASVLSSKAETRSSNHPRERAVQKKSSRAINSSIRPSRSNTKNFRRFAKNSLAHRARTTRARALQPARAPRLRAHASRRTHRVSRSRKRAACFRDSGAASFTSASAHPKGKSDVVFADIPRPRRRTRLGRPRRRFRTPPARASRASATRAADRARRRVSEDHRGPRRERPRRASRPGTRARNRRTN